LGLFCRKAFYSFEVSFGGTRKPLWGTGGHSKSTYDLKGGRGYPRKCTKMYEGEGALKRMYVTHVIFTNILNK